MVTIPFQQGLACSFDTDATRAVFDAFVRVAAERQCRAQIRKAGEFAADAQATRPQGVLRGAGSTGRGWSEAKERTMDSVQRLSGAQDVATALLQLRGSGGSSSSKWRRFADRAMGVLQTSCSARPV